MNKIIQLIITLKYYIRIIGFWGLTYAIIGKITKRTRLLKIVRSDIKSPLLLRIPSSDVPTFSQIYIKNEYDFNVRDTPKIIVDAGANIGIASIYFSNKFPDARIIAIEPEKNNYEILIKNIESYKNITPILGALWNEDAILNVVDCGLGNWGFMMQAQNGEIGLCEKRICKVRGMTVNTIMKEQDINHIDIFKIDIEGSEREVFQDASSWIGNVDSIIIELHERLKPGCNRSFYNGSGGFDNEWTQGENVFLSRHGGCLTKSCRFR